jgi:cellulose biosynthesis protein BcsQ
MATIVVVTSGKGGVGKTTTSASFASGLALRGHKTAVIDFDVGLRNLDLIMGCERRVVFDFINVINGQVKSFYTSFTAFMGFVTRVIMAAAYLGLATGSIGEAGRFTSVTE